MVVSGAGVLIGRSGVRGSEAAHAPRVEPHRRMAWRAGVVSHNLIGVCVNGPRASTAADTRTRWDVG